MVSAADFWEQPFHHLVTYSFNRGIELDVPYEAARQALIANQQALLPTDYLQQYKLKRQLRELESQQETATYPRRITNAQGDFDKTAEQIALVEQYSSTAEQLSEVFRVAGSEIMYAACMPVFRDALVFYDEQGKLLRTLNICFECLYMETDNKVVVEAGVEVYKSLRGLLGQLGHPIESFGW